MFSYSYKFKLSPKNPNVITLTPTARTWAKAIAGPYVFIGAVVGVLTVAAHLTKDEPTLEEQDTIPSE